MADRHQSISSQKILAYRANKRAEKTGLDYVVTALSPALIMLLVGSLVFFLIQVFYRGEMDGGVRWVMFWFVLAIVLVSRIGIEQSTAHATFYGAALATATWVFLMMTHPAFLLGLVLLAVVWWSADRLVRDCTLIDDDVDSSDKGLLERTNNEPSEAPSRRRSHPAAPKRSSRQAKTQSEVKHAPGRWLLYFSLAALPLFGIGQIALSHSNETTHASGFSHLVLYLVAAAGLLLSTSFLGLRRYLRQRSLKMPNRVAAGWLRSGARIAGLVLLLAWLFPRPGVVTAWSGLSDGIEHSIREASQFALNFNPAGTGDKNNGSTRSSNGDSPQETRNEGEAQNTGTPATDQNGETRGEAQPSQASQNTGQNESGSFRWLIILIIGIALLILAYRNRHMIMMFLKEIWETLASLFGPRSQRKKTDRLNRQQSNEGFRMSAKPFHKFQNPFHKGSPQDWSHETLVAYTYEALESWAKQEGTPVSLNQTPLERIRKITATHPHLASTTTPLAAQYNLLAYGRRISPTFDPYSLEPLWGSMTQRG